jgi:hypothetical protein
MQLSVGVPPELRPVFQAWARSSRILGMDPMEKAKDKPRRAFAEIEAEAIAMLPSPSGGLWAAKHLRDEAGMSFKESMDWFYTQMEKMAPPKRPCPYCGVPLASDLARQCLSCGMDWHDPESVVRRGSAK